MMNTANNHDSNPQPDDTLLTSLYSEFTKHDEPANALPARPELEPYQQWRAAHTNRNEPVAGTNEKSATHTHASDTGISAELLEPYRRFKAGELHPQDTHTMVDEHMEAFFAEFSDIAHDAIDSDIVYTELKHAEHDMQVASRSNTPLVIVLSMALLGVVTLGSWFVYKTSEGIDSLRQQLEQLNQQVPKMAIPIPPQSTSATTSRAESPAAKPIAKKSTVLLAGVPAAAYQPAGVETTQPSLSNTTLKPTATTTSNPTEPNTVVTNHSQGNWMIVVSSHLSRQHAEQAISALHDMHIDSQLSQAVVRGRIWFRVILPGFSRKAARQYLKQHKQDQGFESAWVGKNH